MANPDRRGGALSPEQIAQLAYNAGFRGQALVTAVAVALGESGGRPDAMGDTTIQTGTWGPSVGLWQVRSIKRETGKGSTRDQQANLNPARNARAAFEISGGGKNFGPWTVFTKGIYRNHLSRAQQAVSKIGQGNIAVPTDDGDYGGDTGGMAGMDATEEVKPDTVEQRMAKFDSMFSSLIASADALPPEDLLQKEPA